MGRESANLMGWYPPFPNALRHLADIFFIHPISEMSKMGLVLYFGGGCLFPPRFSHLSFIVIHSLFFFFKFSRLKSVGIIIFCLNSNFIKSWTWQSPCHLRVKDIAFKKYKIHKGSKFLRRMLNIESHEICIPLSLVSTAPNEQDASLTLSVLG